jgi:zinc protease
VGAPEVSLEVLPNGLTVLLCPTRLAPVFEFQLWARVGSADERDDERGVAHFHEHMLFKGTERRGVGDVAGDVEGAGGRINAYTSFDVTAYHATLPADQAAVGIDVLCDAVLHSVFDAEEIAREIEVVQEEIRRAEDSPGSVLGNTLFDTVYREHPYRHPILGSIESVGSFDRAKVRDFYERWYHPANLTAVAVGDFERDFVLAKLGEAFHGAREGSGKRVRTAEPTQRGLRSAIARKPFERVGIEMAYPTTGLGHPDTAKLDLLAFILGNGDSSRLVRRVRERDGLVERIDAYSYTPFDAGVSSLELDTDAERAGPAIEACMRELELLRTAPVSEEELEKARVNFLTNEHFERESVSGLAGKIAGFQINAGHHTAEARYLETIRSASAEALLEVAQRYLDPERLTVAAVVPDGEADALDANGIRHAVDRGIGRTTRAFSAPRKLSKPAPTIESYTLEGGATLHVKPRRELPIVAARAALRGGLLAENESTSGITAFTTGMWLRGTANHSAAAFAAAIENRATDIDSFSGRSSFGLTLEAPRETLSHGLDLFADVLCVPAFDAEEFERERRETLAAIERREDRLAQRAFQLFLEHHYPKHPYRMPTLGTAPVIEGLDVESVHAHHRRWVRQGNLVLGVSGDVDPDWIARELSSRLSELEPGPVDVQDPPAEDAPREIRRAELIKERAQAHLVIGFRGVSVHDEDRFALDVISQLLAGQGGRLFLELRDKQGLAYTVNASSVEGLAPGYFALYIATAPERLDEARTGLLSELERLLEAPPSDTELDRARRYLTGNFVIDQQRNAVHAAQMSLQALYGLGANASAETLERIQAVSSDDVLRVAGRILDLGAYTEAVVRP